MSEKEKNENKQAGSPSEESSAAKSDVHPMCENAPNKEKCEEFVERLDEASNNIDRTND